MTIEELQARCVDLAKRIGPNGSASINIGSVLKPYLFVMPDWKGHEAKTFYGTDADEMFALAEEWLAARPDADAEWRSWSAAA